MQKTVRLTLNGKRTEITTEGDRKLLWVLRTDLGLTGTKCGCAAGMCGSCTVLVDNRVQRSCLLSVEDLEGKRVTTIEGLGTAKKLHPVQQAFVEYGALQCGFCTPGMILAAVDLLSRIRRPTEQQILEGLEGHLCRCGAHQRIVQAVQAASRRMR